MQTKQQLANIQLIAFDLFGVLISEGHLVSNGLLTLLPEQTSKKKVKQAYNAYNLGEIQETDFWEAIGQQNDSLLREQFLDLFALDQDYLQVLEHLSERYRLAILSNFPSDWADELVRKFAFDQHFNPYLFSGKVKAAKPDAAIYQALVQQSGIDPHQIAFIDDRLENLHSAHRMGMTTIHLQREPDPHHYQADYQITRLGQLCELFQ